MGSFIPADEATLLAASTALPPGGVAVVDFDGTLLLRNSTQLYLRSLRPQFLAGPLLSLLELVQPWRLLPGANSTWVYRDWMRVLLLSILLPWSPLLWRRACPRIAREHANGALMRALASQPIGRVVVATYGFRFLVAPLLSAMECPWPLCVSATLTGGLQLRRDGKAAVLQQILGAEVLSQSMLVTDSHDDRDFLPLCRQAFLITPDGGPSMKLASTSYLPLQYMHHCKRHGENTIVRVILFYDLLTLCLAFGPASMRPVPCLLGLLFFQIAFWTIYEVGNWENDVLGTIYEDKPRIPPGFDHWRNRVRPRQAWVWAVVMSIPSAVCFAVAIASPGAGAWFARPAPLLAAALFAALLMYLVASRLAYALYNRVDPVTRIFVYPLLQIGKGTALAAILPADPAGLMLLLSVMLVRQLRYVAYRTAKSRHALDIPVNLHILACHVLLCAVWLALTGVAPLSFWLVAGFGALWHLHRGRRDLLELRRGFVWLPRRCVVDRPKKPAETESSANANFRTG